MPLHGGLTAEAQRRAFAPAPAGSRKVVLSTNVAETSVTIPDVAAVIDTGRVKRLRRDPSVPGVASLREGWCSRASATQRMGRAGRVREGLCVRLYPRSVFEREMRDRDPPDRMPKSETSTSDALNVVKYSRVSRRRRSSLADAETRAYRRDGSRVHLRDRAWGV